MLDEPEQELSMIHISTGQWVLGIDLVLDDKVTKNPLGMVYITGEENLYHASHEEVGDDMKAEDIEKVKEVRKTVQSVADEMGVPVDKLINAVVKLGSIFQEKGIVFEDEPDFL